MSKENCEKYKNQIKDLNKKIGDYEERNNELTTELDLKAKLLKDLKEGGISVETYTTIIDIYDRQSRIISTSSIQLDDSANALKVSNDLNAGLKNDKEQLQKTLKIRGWILNKYTIGLVLLLIFIICVIFYVTPRFPVTFKIGNWVEYSTFPATNK